MAAQDFSDEAISDRTNDARAKFRLLGQNQRLIAPGINKKPVSNVIGRYFEALGRCVNAPFGLNVRIFKIVKTDAQRAFADFLAVDWIVARHSQSLANLDR